MTKKNYQYSGGVLGWVVIYTLERCYTNLVLTQVRLKVTVYLLVLSCNVKFLCVMCTTVTFIYYYKMVNIKQL